MQIELSKVSFTDASLKFRGKMYVGVVSMKAWLNEVDTKTETPVIETSLRGLLKKGLRASVPGPENTVVDGELLTDEECYKKFTDQLKPQINSVVAEYEAAREQKILDDPKLDDAITALEVSVNG